MEISGIEDDIYGIKMAEVLRKLVLDPQKFAEISELHLK
jgi:hypothetical protein